MGLVRDINHDFGDGTWLGSEARLIRIWGPQTLTAGAEYRFNLRQHQRNYDGSPAFTNADDTRRSHVAAVYLQDEVALASWIKILGGVRHDYYDTFGGTTNPRLGAILQPAAGTTFKLLYGRAFRAPNVYEQFYEGGGSKPNPDLKPERIGTVEAVLEQSLGEKTRLVASAFDYRITDLISQTTDPDDGLIYFRNADRVRAVGGELEVESRLSRRLEGRVSLIVQNAEDRGTGERLTNSPRYSAGLGLSANLVRRKLWASLDGRYLGSRRSVQDTEVPGFVVVNLGLSGRRVLGGLDVSAGIYNLLDEQYGDPGGEEHLQAFITQNGRGFRLKLSYGV